MNKTTTTKNEQETLEFAKNFAKNLKGGEIIGLIGDLGAGKTIFSKGIAQGLNYKKSVVSPTFVLMKIYDIEKNNTKRIKHICHIDAYKLSLEEDLLSIGANDYVGQKDTVSIIEWVDNIIDFIPQNVILIKIKIKEGLRILEIIDNK